MESKDTIELLKDRFLYKFIESGYTTEEALECWDIYIKTLEEGIVSLTLPGAKDIKDPEFLRTETRRLSKLALKRMERL
jgi:hypothetical protein